MPASTQVVEYTIPPLVSGGIMLTYRCSNTCRHCLYCCSPRLPDEWMSPDTAERVCAALAEEPQLQSLHLSGGEPFLRLEVLERAVRTVLAAKLPLDYVETNASWCVNAEAARTKLERVREAGLRRILVSCSVFHNEFVPFERTRLCVETARHVFGPDNVIVWLPDMYELLESMPDDGTHTIEAFCEWAGIEPNSGALPRLYGVIPGGRAATALRGCYELQAASYFREAACRRELMNTHHFHIDHEGNLFTGLCAGLAPALVDDLHPEIEQATHPVFWLLCERGPFALMRQAVEEFDYEERPEGYTGKCDLCLDVRRHLCAKASFPELRPAFFYAAPAAAGD